MRVGINVEPLFYRAPGGTGRYAARLASSLAAQFSADTIVTFSAWHSRRAQGEVFARFGLDRARLGPAVRLPLPRPVLFDAWNGLAWPNPQVVSGALKAADVVHNPFPGAPPVKAPLVVSVHDAGPALYPESYPRRGLRYHTKAMERVAQRADRVITLSHAAAGEILAHTALSEESVRVVPPGVDQDRATPDEISAALARHDLAGAPYVLWVGSLEPRKNVGALVKAFITLGQRQEVPHRLVLVGPLGWRHQGLISDQERALLGDRLRALGPVTDGELRALYAGASLFAFPSIHEGFGLPILEAMVQGAPVVCSDIAALAEASGGAAVLVPPQEPERWAQAIADVALDPARQSVLRAAGYTRASHFTWEKTALATHVVYEELIGA